MESIQLNHDHYRETVIVPVIRTSLSRDVLLVHMAYPDEPSNSYRLIQGGVDRGETLVEAAVRETKEEVGIDLELVDDCRFKLLQGEPLSELEVAEATGSTSVRLRDGRPKRYWALAFYVGATALEDDDQSIKANPAENVDRAMFFRESSSDQALANIPSDPALWRNVKVLDEAFSESAGSVSQTNRLTKVL